MIAVSLKDGDDLVDLFLQKGAEVNATSKCSLIFGSLFYYLHFDSFHRTGRHLRPT